MLREKKFIWINRIIIIGLITFCFIFPVIDNALGNRGIELVDDEVLIEYEYSYSTTCSAKLVFNKNVTEVNAKIAFYDDTDKLLSVEKVSFDSWEINGKTAEELFIDVSGKVSSYEILDWEADYNSYDSGVGGICCVAGMLIALFFLIPSLLLSCRVYHYNNRTIVVYAGYYRHYIKIDGEKYDEHNTLVTFTPIVMSTTLENGEVLQATVSTFNRIALKINNKLVKK